MDDFLNILNKEGVNINDFFDISFNIERQKIRLLGDLTASKMSAYKDYQLELEGNFVRGTKDVEGFTITISLAIPL